MALSPNDLYEVLAEVLTEGGYADGSPTSVKVNDPDAFRDLAEHLQSVLDRMGVEVESGEIPVLDSDGGSVSPR